jgi:hypothetical protein
VGYALAFGVRLPGDRNQKDMRRTLEAIKLAAES